LEERGYAVSDSAFYFVLAENKKVPSTSCTSRFRR
jgi:hypothetical protein